MGEKWLRKYVSVLRHGNHGVYQVWYRVKPTEAPADIRQSIFENPPVRGFKRKFLPSVQTGVCVEAITTSRKDSVVSHKICCLVEYCCFRSPWLGPNVYNFTVSTSGKAPEILRTLQKFQKILKNLKIPMLKCPTVLKTPRMMMGKIASPPSGGHGQSGQTKHLGKR